MECICLLLTLSSPVQDYKIGQREQESVVAPIETAHQSPHKPQTTYKDPIDDLETDDESDVSAQHIQRECHGTMVQSDDESTLLDDAPPSQIQERFSYLCVQSSLSETVPEDLHSSNILHSNSLASTLRSLESPFIPKLEFMTELSMIHEVLIMLQGRNSKIFKFADENVNVSQEYAVRHLSRLAMAGLLNEFAEMGRTAQRVRTSHTRQVMFIHTCINSNSCIRHSLSPIYEAFSHALQSSLLDFEKEVADLTEFYTANNVDHVQFGRHASILQLKDGLHDFFERLKILDGFSGLVQGKS